MSDITSMWEDYRMWSWIDTVYKGGLEKEARQEGARKRGRRTALALCATVLLSALPAMAIGASNGSFDSPPPNKAASGLAPDVQLPEAAPTPQVTETVVVTVPVPKRVVFRAPRTCETRGLEHTGGKVRVCARPATPITHRARPATELAKLYR